MTTDGHRLDDLCYQPPQIMVDTLQMDNCILQGSLVIEDGYDGVEDED